MNSALIVIDMQNAFCHPNGSLAARGISIFNYPAVLNNIKCLINWARNRNMLVLYTKQEFADEYDGIIPNIILPIIKTNKYLKNGTWDAALIDELTPINNEPVVTKSTYDAFCNPILYERLIEHNVSHLYFTGVMSDICVESTLRAALSKNFVCTLVADASSSTTELRHNLLCERVTSNFGFIQKTIDILNNDIG